MGNLITAMVTVISPMLSKQIFIPIIMHPSRLGGIPFTPPGPFKYTFFYLLFTFLLIGTAATISGMMTTARECQKIQLWTAVVNARWSLLFALIGLAFVTLLPFTKSTAIALFSWVPYANLFVTGLYVAVFVLIGGMLGNTRNIKDVCGR